MQQHIRETTTSTDLLIESGEDHPAGQLLVDCSCGEEYYVELIKGLSEFESLEQGRREHAVKAQGGQGALYNLLHLAKALENQDPRKIAQDMPGTLNLKGSAYVVYRAFVELFDRIELLEGELANVRESSAAAKQLLELELTAHRQRAAYQGSGALDPLTRMIMVAEELDNDPENNDTVQMAEVLREVYSDLKRVLSTVHPDSAYVGDRVRASWEIWDNGTFVEKVTHEGEVVAARVPGTNFITFIDEDGVRHGPMVHNYVVIERFTPKVED